MNITGNNNRTASLVCNRVDPKLAEQIRSIVNGTRRSEGALKEMSGKLDLILKQMPKEAIPPDVGLRLVFAKSPALMVVNYSAAIARNIKYAVVLWNMDLQDRNDPLPIPVATFDWLRPNDQGGPQDLFAGPLVAPLLKPGNRLFGSATVSCPDCLRGRTYVVYIVWGEGGWVSEIEDEQSGHILVPPSFSFSKESRSKYFEQLEGLVPQQSRMPIPDHP